MPPASDTVNVLVDMTLVAALAPILALVAQAYKQALPVPDGWTGLINAALGIGCAELYTWARYQDTGITALMLVVAGFSGVVAALGADHLYQGVHAVNLHREAARQQISVEEWKLQRAQRQAARRYGPAA